MYNALISVTGATIFSDRMASKYPEIGGVQNAARHQFGQCIMTQRTNEQIAATTANLHEAERPSTDEDSRIDQANNRIGRAIGRRKDANCEIEVEKNLVSGNIDWEPQAARQFLNPVQ